MTTIPELLQAAAAWRHGEQIGSAEQAYRQILQFDPSHFEALNQLGLIAHEGGRAEIAVECLSRAVAVRPADAECRNNFGAALLSQGRTAEAEAAFRAALHLRPDYAAALVNLGIVFQARGRPTEAETVFREALRLRPGFAEAQSGLGDALREQGRLAEAEAAYQQALRLRPDAAEVQNNLACVLSGQGRLAEAEAAFREAIRLRPDFAEAHNNWGIVLQGQGRLAEAEAVFREALRLRPDGAEAHYNLGHALREQGRLAEAETACRAALRRNPDFADAHNNLGMLLLSQGRFPEGWAEYEWRWQAHGLTPPALDRPAWDGTPLAGTLLLYVEQGTGDTLQFIRYAALAKRRVGTVVVSCPPALLPLLSSCAGIDRLVGGGSPLPAFDAHAPLASLPRLLGTTAATIPVAVPYLAADPERVRYWRDQLAFRESRGAYRIGIAWQGSPGMGAYDRRRSFPLVALAPLARLPGLRLVVLQKGHGREQLAATPADWPLTNFGERLDAAGAFVDTAALMRNLDLVVSCDSAPAHLAGSLGVPCWVALPHAADWRWLLDREDSPWYPSLRLYRQPRPGDWAAVFERMADNLRERLNLPPVSHGRRDVQEGRP